mgnify:CR=1 FL=1
MASTDEFEPNLEIKRDNEIQSYKNKKKIINDSEIPDDIFGNETVETSMIELMSDHLEDFTIVHHKDAEPNSNESIIDTTVKYISDSGYSLWNAISESVSYNLN